MIDYDTILSTTEDKMTLLQWLKKVEAALKDASATSFKVNKKGNATLTFSIVFADGTELESGEIILQQGESVESVAIVNGHLILTLTNGDELDAGDLGGVTSFSIDASQHLIVHYQNGTTQDLGAIFNGDISINGTLSASGFLKPVDVADQLDVDISVGGTQHDLNNLTAENCPVTITYGHARISNGKLSIVIAGYLRPTEAITQALDSANALFETADFRLSYAMSTKIYNESGSNTGSGYISWKREKLTYIQDWGSPAASSHSNGLAAAVYRGSGYRYKVQLFVLEALSLVYNSGYKYDFRFEFNYNL
ncbi:MAG: hypothetical protein IKD73_08400 [Selenomonadaceae bacterium]|nr:hypothetical protein [Selenomonadaceae bacterium]